MNKSVGDLLVVWIFFFLNFDISGQNLLINEFQNQNFRSIADEDGDYEDWVEIYNSSNTSISLFGYGLSDDQGNPFRWTFPDTTIAAGDYLIIWLSGKNRSIVGSNLHANFSLSSNEPILLSSPDLSDVEIVPPIELLRDISYGLTHSSHYGYFQEPTPGAPNLTEFFSGICDPPVFSVGSGFYENEFSLAISSAPGTSIIYTLDGSEPDASNITSPSIFTYKNSYPFLPTQPFGEFLIDSLVSHLYTGPLLIQDRSNEPDNLSQKSSTNDFDPTYFPGAPSYKGTVIRAVSTSPGMIPSETITKVYFITPEGWNRYNLPVASLVLTEVDLTGYQTGIHTAGRIYDLWREANPDAFPPPIAAANYGRRGFEAEKVGYVDFLDTENQVSIISGEVGVRIHGSSSRKWPRKSFRLYARNLYNTDQFDYPFFDDHPTTAFERLILRNGGSDEWLSNMRDGIIQRMAKPMRLITIPFSPYYVFLNGEFYGLNHLREFIDDNYFKIRFGLEREHLDLIKGIEIDVGDEIAYNEVANLCTNESFADEASMTQFSQLVEVNSFMDVFVVNTITANSDMFSKNTLWWRDKSPHSEDNRFKSILVDLDKAWGHRMDAEMASPQYDMISHFLDSTDEAMTPYLVCFLSAMENEDFRRNFILRSADVLNTFFTSARTTSLIEDLRELYLPNYQEHIDRWSWENNMQTLDEWLLSIDSMLAFSEARPDFHRLHINDFFEGGGIYKLALDVSDPDHGFIHLNTIDIRSETEGIETPVFPWVGKYFKDIAVDMTAVPNEGFLFSHWEGAIESTNAEVSSTFSMDSVYVKAVFMPDTTLGNQMAETKIKINVFPNPSYGHYNLENNANLDITSLEIFDIAGKRVLRHDLSVLNDFHFNLKGESGIYFLHVTFQDGTMSRTKLVKL